MKNLVLQTVIIKNDVPFNNAYLTAFNIMKKEPHKVDITKTSYRFRHLDPKLFVKKSFRTKKVNDSISLVFGKLKPGVEGGAIFGAKLDYSNDARKNKEKYGNYEIIRLNIYRTPISNLLVTGLNLISFGLFKKLMQRYGFDKLFHLALIATIKTEQGIKNVIMEKNEIVNVSTNYATKETTEIYEIDISNISEALTVNKILDTALNNVGKELFFYYDPFKNNCQFFIKYLLEGQGLYSNDVKNFVFQDLKELYNDLPAIVPTIAKFATDVASTIAKWTGRGFNEDEIVNKLTDDELEFCAKNPEVILYI